MAKEAYKGHRAGSTKGDVHKRYDEKGADAAIKLAVARGIKEATARTWASAWKNGTGTAKKKTVAKKAAPAKKPAAKKTVKKAVTKKAAPAKKPAKKPRPEFGPDAEKAQAAA